MADRFARVIEELYRVAPDAFLRERKARAAALKKAGEPAQAHAVSQLKRPSPPLWATNQLAHEAPEQLAAFLDNAERVVRLQLSDPRQAGEALRRQRAELDALVARAGELLARQNSRATPATLRRISDTLLGAAVDRDRAQELRRGRLTQELSPPGFEVLAGAPRGGHLKLVPSGPAPRGEETRPPPRREETSARQAERRTQVEEQRQRRDREAEALERAAAERQSAADEVAREIEELARKLGAARTRLAEAQRASKTAAARAREARRRSTR
jgi:hypothetical protein